MKIEKAFFGKTPAKEEILKYTLKNPKGMEVDIITYGGIITRLTAPDRNGRYENVVLGYDNLDQYIKSSPYYGAIVGRYANRIANGQFQIDGNTYILEANDGTNNLHGGVVGFDKVVWKTKELELENDIAIELYYVSPDGESGFPGNLTTKVRYTLTNNNELIVDYEAFTDKKTVVNLTQHSYFNLSGDLSKSILDHELSINADHYLPVDEVLIPVGEFADVSGTPFDFKSPKLIGKDIDKEDVQLKLAGGYDHSWVLNDESSFGKAATLYHSESGRTLEVFTDKPGIQFYSGNYLDGALSKPNDGIYADRSGLCLETQYYPDSPNQPSFPSTILEPGEEYRTKTAFKFNIQ